MPIASSGQQYHFKNYNIEDGLAQSQVRSIFQDSKGFLWIGTLGGGVSKYDGLEFKNYSAIEGLCDNNILSIIEDHTGSLWFGTYGGVCRYDGKTFTTITTEDGLSHNTVLSILEDRAGNLWFGTDGGGVSKYNGETFTTFTIEDGLSHDIVLSILEDQEGNLWFGTDGGACTYDGKTFTSFSTKDGLSNNRVRVILEDRAGNLWFGTDGGGVSKYNGKKIANFTEKSGLINNMVWTIVEDHEGNLWFGTSGGVSKYDGKTFTNFSTKDGLSNNTVWSMIEDREGNLWIGSYRGGLDRYGSSPFALVTAKEGLSDNIVRSILEDRKGNLWFGTYRAGTSKYDGRTFTHFSAKDGLVDDFVLTIFEDREGNLWFGTYRGVSKYDGRTFANFTENDGLRDSTVRSILEDQKGNLWFGTDRRGIYRYDGTIVTEFTINDGLNDNEILTIFEDSNGNIWIGTGRGISKFDGKNFINFSENHGLRKNDNIYVILDDTKGNLWFGIYGEGIIKYTPSRLKHDKQGKNDESGDSFVTFTNKDGLYNNNVVSMIFDNAGNLWIGTEGGINTLNTEQYENTGRIVFKHYGSEEGFTGVECIHNSVFQDSKENIWFGTLRGAIKYTAKEDRPNKTEPLTHIANLRLFFEDFDWSNYANRISNKNGLPIGLRLPYNHNHITFDFIGISLVVPEKVRYQYKLEGFDRSWSPVTKESYATYSNLPHRKYTFNVKACNNDGVWNKEPVTFSFEINSPFWNKWWFYVLTLLFVAGSIRVYTRFKVKKLEKINLELEKLTLVASKTENAVIIAHATGSIEWVNEGFTRMTGYTLEELKELKRDTIKEIGINPPIADTAGKNDIDRISRVYESLVNAKDREELWVSLTLTPIPDKKRELKKLVIIGSNITERKRAERDRERLQEQLIQSEKMAGIGTLTSGIAHEFNNLLQIMRGHTEYAQITKKPEDVEEAFNTVLNTSDRVSKIIIDLLTFSRQEAPEKKLCDITKPIESVLSLTEDHLKKNNIEIVRKYSRIPPIEVDKGKMEQVFLNMVNNARDSMLPKGGRLEIRIRRDKEHVEVSFTDTGLGIKREDLGKVFEPFYTTKGAVGGDSRIQGVGLGLSVSYGIVKSHGGTVEVESKPGKGTTFVVKLPLEEKKEEE